MKHEPEAVDLERTCIATRTVCDPSVLIRYVRAPDGTVTPDIRRKLPGRGCWVRADREAVALAVKRKAFVRALGDGTVTPPDLPERVEALLERDALGLLSMANKAGAVITGFDSVLGLVESGKAIAILHAREAARDGRRKLAQARSRATRSGNSSVEAFSPFTVTQMDLALGRTHVIHAALSAASVARACLDRCRILLRYRGDTGSEATDETDIPATTD
ncbi:MAG: RNA-binding protein [Beijerinckiaceae bacterium]